MAKSRNKQHKKDAAIVFGAALAFSFVPFVGMTPMILASSFVVAATTAWYFSR